MNKTIERIKILFTSVPTYLVAGSTVVTILSEEIAEVLPTSASETVAAVALKVVGVLGAAVSIIRRSTPVIFPQRGLLPVDGPVIPQANVPSE